jgi:hypothetical protein
MFINEGSVKIELDFYECWDIGNAVLQGVTRDSHVAHWSNHGFTKFLDSYSKEIKMARQFCNFSNPEWVDQKLAEFNDKLIATKENK